MFKVGDHVRVVNFPGQNGMTGTIVECNRKSRGYKFDYQIKYDSPQQWRSDTHNVYSIEHLEPYESKPVLVEDTRSYLEAITS